ncbi:hypothetical protein B0J14DRAFT_658022 [Halenospora varia]|nr:hypothetical protein B0J14DRAFT_658022 [Halenospora varia]
MTASALSVGGNSTRPGLVNGRELANLTGALNSTFTDLQSLTLFAQNVWSLPQSQLKPITFQSLAATVSTLSLSPNASILEVAPGAAKTLYWLPSLLSASGEPVGCDNSSLNGLPGTRITSPYLERDGSMAGGLDFRNEGKVVSGGPTVTSSTSTMATSAMATPTANVEAKKSLGVAKGVDRVNCALVAMGVLCMGAFML